MSAIKLKIHFGYIVIFSRSSKYLYNETSVLLGRKGSVDKPKIVFEPFWCSDTTYFTKIYKKVKPIFFYFLVQQIKFDQLNIDYLLASQV